MKQLFFVMILATLVACDGPKQTASYSDEKVGNEPQEIVKKDYPGFKGEVYRTVENYLLLKDALVKSDSVMARDYAGGLRRELVDSQADSLEANQREAWLATKKRLDGVAQEISGTDNLSVQREKFSQLSGLMAEVVQTYELPEGETVYRQFCPMAFDNEGGYWLSAEEEIMNPYFGDQMLKCGRVDKTLSF
ncbi:MAG: DUF3347 domain-containing protein [Catalinimonas sp.]